MDRNLHDIENLFRDGLEDNEEKPSPHLWIGIDNILNSNDIINFKKKYNSLGSLTLLLLLLLAGISVYQLISRDKNNVEISEKQQRVSKTIVNGADINGVSLDIGSVKRLNVLTKNSSYDSENILSVNRTNSRKTISSNLNKNDNQNIISDNSVLANANKILISKNLIRANQRDARIKPNASENKSLFKWNDPYKKILKNNTSLRNKEQLVNNYYKEKNIRIEHVRIFAKNYDNIKRPVIPVVIDKIISPFTKHVTTSFLKDKKSGISAFSITPFFSPDFAWYSLKDDDDNHHNGANEIEREEKHKFSSTFGVLVNYKLNWRWGLQSGITYSNTNITLEPKILYAQPDNAGSVKYLFNTSSGYGYVLPSFSNNPAIGDSLYALTSVNTLKYIGIPIAAKYIIITKGKMELNLTAGVSINFLTTGQIETTLARDFEKETEIVKNIKGLNKIYIDGISGFGIDYKLGERATLTFDPTLKFALNSINKNAPVKSYPKSLGLYAGIKISL